MVDGYWKEVLTGAWTETKDSFHWNKKTVAAALTAGGTIFVAYLRGGFADMTTTATGYFWIALAPFLAAAVLFIWNVIETQGKLFAALAEHGKEKISSLELKLARLSSDEPNYAAVKLLHQFTLAEASRLWVGIDHNALTTRDSQIWCDVLMAAIQRGELEFIPKNRLSSLQIDYEKANPSWDTKVTKEALRKYAKSIDESPRFLSDD